MSGSSRRAGGAEPGGGLVPQLRAGKLQLRGEAGTVGSAVLTQCDATTCGATSVLTARLLIRGAPHALRSAGPDGLERALGEEIRRIQAVMNRRAGGPLGPLPWTRLLGSTPWAVARALTALRLTDAPYRVRWVHDRAEDWPDAVQELGAVVGAGCPAALLSGGPLRLAGRRLGPAIPRHYVLAVPAALVGRPEPGPGAALIHDPASGTVSRLDLLALGTADAPGPRALGGWPRVLALIAPLGGAPCARAGGGGRPWAGRVARWAPTGAAG